MALQYKSFLSKPMSPLKETRIPTCSLSSRSSSCFSYVIHSGGGRLINEFSSSISLVCALDKQYSRIIKASNKRAAPAVPNSDYVVPLDKSSCITRPLAEILRDLNKKVPDQIIKPGTNCIHWFHANRMLSFYAPGWCGEIRDVIFSENGSVTVVYRVTIRGTDGVAHRESSGTVLSSDVHIEDPVTAAEEIAFSRACARFGLGLYLYHDEETQ